MKVYKSKKLSLLIALIITVALFAVFPVQADASDVIFNKTVLDPGTGLWVETIDADVGDTVRFNLTLEYNGLTNIYDIMVLEELPESLNYVGGSAQFINHVDQTPTEVIIGNKIYWNFTGVNQLVLNTVDNTMSIEFDATVQYGENAINNASINVTEPDFGIIEKYDTAEVNIMPYTFAKKIEEDGIWVDEADAIVGDIVKYKIALRYYGVYNLTNISITDTLPDFLEFTGSKVEILHGNGDINYSADNKTFWVNFTDILKNEVPEDPDRVEVQVTAYLNDTTSHIHENIAEVEMDHVIDNVTTDPLSATENAFLEIVPNDPPNKPSKPTGDVVVSQGYGITGASYDFNTSAIDPNEDQMSFNFSWDDGEYSGWTELVDSGQVVVVSHSWSTPGIKEITVIAKDFRGAISEISDHLLLQIFVDDPDVDIYPPDDPRVPTGNSTGEIGETLTYTTNTTDPDGSTVKYGWDWDDGTPIEWTIFYPSGENCSKSHSWSSGGTYDVRVKAMDVHNRESDWSDTKTVIISGATPPIPVKPSGDTNVLINEVHEYQGSIPSSSTTDAFIQFVWGDGSSTSWLGPYAPGVTVNQSNSWSQTGNYNVKVRVSYYSDGSSYSEGSSLQVKVISGESNITIETIKGGLGVKATIKNNGDEDADEVEWKIQIEKRLFGSLDVTIEDTTNLSAGSEVVASATEGVRGFGRVTITVKVYYEGDKVAEEIVNGLIFGPFVIVLQSS